MTWERNHIGGMMTPGDLKERLGSGLLSFPVTHFHSDYSSAVFNFVPELALRFFNAMRRGGKATTEQILKDFFFPFARIRDRVPGYAISSIKSGVRLIGMGSGPVRAPLTDLTAEEDEMLAQLIGKANS